MRIIPLALLGCCFLALPSCTNYQIPSLEVSLNSRKGRVDDEVINLTELIPYLKRATWSDSRQPFTVWKAWREVRMENGTVLLILNQGSSFSSFRIVGVDGEYYIRGEDLEKFDSALAKALH